MNHLFEKHFEAATLNEVCARYGINPKDTNLIKADNNLIYDCGERILRVSYSGTRTESDIEAEVNWMRFLHRQGLSVPKTIPSLAGELTERIDKPEDHFTAVLFEKIPGSKISKATWNATHFQNLGRLTGRLHNSNEQYYQQQPTHGIKHWDELVECSYTDLLPEDERELGQLHDQLISKFRTYEISMGTYGLIHNDIHFENYLLMGPENKIVLFDFEVACQSWYVYEIATALYYACLVNRKRNDVAFEQTFLSNFLVGYREVRDLPPVDFEVILKFMLYRDVFLLAYRSAIWLHREMSEQVLRHVEIVDHSIAVRRERLGW